MKRRLLPIAALFALGACAEGLPLVERIASTRPLAVRVEAVEVGADPVRAEALPLLDTVRIVPLIVDPAGALPPDVITAQMDPVWLGCALQPIEGLFSCLSNALPLAPEDVPECPAFDPSMLDPSGAQLPTLPSPCFIASTPVAEPEFRVPLDVAFLLGGDLELTMVAHVPGAGDTQACLEQLLGEAGSIARDCVFVTQRVAVGPDGQLLELAEQFGVPDVSQFGVIPDEIPEPDTHPRITSVSVRVLDEDGALIATHLTSREGGVPIAVKVGQRLDIEAIAPQSDLQTYLIPRDMTSFDERTESYEGSWFITWGTLLSPTSDDPLSLNSWTIHRGEQDETDLPPDGLARLFYVLRDDRQGVDWWSFEVAVEEP
jgi:hypothetical protein